jgi:hypothetical protein
MTLRNSIVASAALILASSTAGLAQETLFELGEPTNTQESSKDIIARYEMQMNPKQLQQGEAAELVFNLPDAKILVKLQPVSPRDILIDRKASVWQGLVFDASDAKNLVQGEINIMRQGEFLQARITYKGRIFVLRAGDGLKGTLEEYRPIERDHPEGVEPPIELPSPKIGKDQPDSLCTDTSDQIDIMVVYTQAAKEAASTAVGEPITDSAAIENEIAFGLGQANLALANSNAFHRYNLVRVDQVTYDEAASGGASTSLLAELGNTSDLIVDEVHGWRDSAKADLVSLITADGDCGWGNTVQTANSDTTDHRGFTVLRRGCLNSNLSLGHETGHNMGGLHDRDNSSTVSSFTPPYNHGFQKPSPTDGAVSPWRTNMAYGCSGVTCARVTQFSNPGVNFPSIGGDPTGDAMTDPEPENNVMVFAQNDDAVSRYRCAKTDQEIANVWGKDTWADTGLEPDPATAGASMWQSPYIWVRNAQDTTMEHEHEHENPDLGEDPHVYVKFHNDGNLSENGDVELYFADAATSLNTPANWTLINTQPATISTGVDIFEFPWSGLPGTGHYCLMARWNNTGTPLSFSSIDAYVRGDGGHIWRNVNIVGMDEDEAPDSANQFQVRGIDGVEEVFLRIETHALDTRKVPWNKVAQIHLNIDKDVLGQDLKLVGVTDTGDGFMIPLNDRVKFIGPLLLKPEQTAKANVVVKRDTNVIIELSKQLGTSAHYRISVQQVSKQALVETAKPLGGVAFPAKLIFGGVDYTLRVPAPEK